MHSFSHSNTHPLTSKHTDTHTAVDTSYPLALTASQSLQPSMPASTGVSGSLLERPHTTSSHPRSSAAHRQPTSETLITPHSLWLDTLLVGDDRLYCVHGDHPFPTPEGRKHLIKPQRQVASNDYILHVHSCLPLTSHGRYSEVRLLSFIEMFTDTSCVHRLCHIQKHLLMGYLREDEMVTS